jgi:hypothetical protein
MFEFSVTKAKFYQEEKIYTFKKMSEYKAVAVDDDEVKNSSLVAHTVSGWWLVLTMRRKMTKAMMNERA